MTLEILFKNGEKVCSIHAPFKDEDKPVFLLQKDAENFLDGFLEGDSRISVVVEEKPPITLLVALINATRSKGVSLAFLCQGEVQGDFYPLELL